MHTHRRRDYKFFQTERFLIKTSRDGSWICYSCGSVLKHLSWTDLILYCRCCELAFCSACMYGQFYCNSCFDDLTMESL